ncbi:hypothetical protein NSED_09035 [Candidatus Nitrosopumilus sediminis]|uniref:Uncharacterized protein n=1 Tax=Candidatus Nitrosopumilus sediminis TaxID=1229909 RepID=K0BEV0_9ARCH|nr:hypothetical protein NSED_09035 [Candidatus Nitrosopumilus sediminis]
MKLVLMNNQRGTSSYFSNNLSQKRFEKTNQITLFSYIPKGNKITTNRGTKSRWIIKKPLIGIPSRNKIIIVNRGTQRLML